MDPRSERRLAIARRVGADVEDIDPVEIRGRMHPRWRVVTHGNEHAMRLFMALAEDDAENDPLVRSLAGTFKARAGRLPLVDREPEIARLCHRYVRTTVAFQMEEVESIRTSMTSLTLGEGDCEDHAAIMIALALASGLEAWIAAVRTYGQISHAVAILRVNGVPTWAETTVAAELGEKPEDAVIRLGLAGYRTDVRG